jgi:hypothetical protein
MPDTSCKVSVKCSLWNTQSRLVRNALAFASAMKQTSPAEVEPEEVRTGIQWFCHSAWFRSGARWRPLQPGKPDPGYVFPLTSVLVFSPVQWEKWLASNVATSSNSLWLWEYHLKTTPVLPHVRKYQRSAHLLVLPSDWQVEDPNKDYFSW